MQRHVAFFLVCAVGAAVACPMGFTGDSYQAGTASSKASSLWSNIKANTKSGSWHTFRQFIELGLTEDLNTSFAYVGDTFPKQTILGVPYCRAKLIHSVGAIAQVKFVSYGNHSYNGAYTGCDNAILRFSAAQTPTSKGVQFGIAAKCLRSKTASSTLLGMYSLLPVVDFNPFAHDFSNNPPAINPKAAYVDLALQLLAKRFATASEFPSIMGLSDWALYDQNGNQQKPVFPYRLIFHPTTAIHNMYEGAAFTKDSQFLDQLSQMGTQAVLFELWAVPFFNATTSQYQKIGYVQMTTPFTTSNFGDANLFYEHVMREEDLYYKPDWRDDTVADQNEQLSYLDLPFFWDDLPWN